MKNKSGKITLKSRLPKKDPSGTPKIISTHLLQKLFFRQFEMQANLNGIKYILNGINLTV